MKRMEQVPGGFTNFFFGSSAAHNRLASHLVELLCLFHVLLHMF